MLKTPGEILWNVLYPNSAWLKQHPHSRIAFESNAKAFIAALDRQDIEVRIKAADKAGYDRGYKDGFRDGEVEDG